MTKSHRVGVHRLERHSFTFTEDNLADESLVHLKLNDNRITTLLATCDDLSHLWLGHIATEYGMALWPANANLTQKHHQERGVTVNMESKGSPVLAEREQVVTSSCGACNKEDLPELLESLPVVDDLELDVTFDDVNTLLEQMREQQQGFKETGGMHAAGMCYGVSAVEFVAEDIGRHNAVDKVIGRHISVHPTQRPIILLLSGRIGWDIVAKAARMNIPLIVSVGAASSLAAQTARFCNITLLSFLSGGKSVVIGPHRGRLNTKT